MAAWATGWIAAEHGLRPEPFFLGLALTGLGLGLSVAFVRETAGHVAVEVAARTAGDRSDGFLTSKQVFAHATWREPALSSASQAGLVNNLNEGMAWGLFPLFFAANGLSLREIGTVIAIAPAMWGVGQLFTGGLSDRYGRKWFIAAGQWTEAAGLVGHRAR